MDQKSVPKPKRPIARSILVGVIILAVAAVIIAWVDQSGVARPFLQALTSGRY